MSREILSQPLMDAQSLPPRTEVFSPGRRPAATSASPRTVRSNESMNTLALQISVVLNIVISIVKLFATIVSGSLAVTATLVDSLLDVLSQFILFYTDSASRKHDAARFPAGRTRLAPLGVFICAVIMGLASIEVVRESLVKLRDMWCGAIASGEGLTMDSVIVIGGMGFSFFAKAGLYWYCTSVHKVTGNDTVKAVALDHLNDVLSIFSATLAAVTSYCSASLLWVDPVSAILISVYIMREWWETAEDQANMLVGKVASSSFLDEVRKLADAHHLEMKVDVIRAYHFGPKYLVEIEVVLPPTMRLKKTHDIGMELQHKVEAFEEVERAFVHIDYVERDYDEHNENSWPEHYAERVKASLSKSLDV